MHVEHPTQRRAAVAHRDEAPVDVHPGHAAQRQLGEIEQAAEGVAQGDAVDEHGDLLRSAASQRDRGELPESAERSHVGAGRAGEQLGQAVVGRCPARCREIDRGPEARGVSAERALILERAVRGGLDDGPQLSRL